MKQGRTLQEVAAEIERQNAQKHDYMATTRLLDVRTDHQHTYMNLGSGIGRMPLNDHAHTQLASHLGIPKTYYDRLRDQMPTLLDENINTLLGTAEPGEKRLVRTLDGNVRAWLSDTYRPRDNHDLMAMAIMEFQQHPDLQVQSCEVTDRRLYVKVTTPRLMREVRVGERVSMGLLLQNSEIGLSPISVLPFSMNLVCTNGMVHEVWGKKSRHVGRRAGGMDEGIESFLSDDTRRLEDMAFFMKMRDVIRATLTEVTMDRLVADMRRAAGIYIEEPEGAIEEVTRRSPLLESEKGGILAFLAAGGDMTGWGLANAVTAFSSTVDDYDRATELESLGGKLVDLSTSEWRVIASAKAPVSDRALLVV